MKICKKENISNVSKIQMPTVCPVEKHAKLKRFVRTVNLQNGAVSNDFLWFFDTNKCKKTAMGVPSSEKQPESVQRSISRSQNRLALMDTKCKEVAFSKQIKALAVSPIHCTRRLS